MIRLSFDGRRLHVTNSLYSTWDNQFYSELRSWVMRINLRPGRRDGDRRELLSRPPRPPRRTARAHEVRLQSGDCTTEIFQ